MDFLRYKDMAPVRLSEIITFGLTTNEVKFWMLNAGGGINNWISTSWVFDTKDEAKMAYDLLCEKYSIDISIENKKF